MSTRARIISNYSRLLITFLAGLLIVRLMAEIGPSALTIYLLLAAGTGFAFALKIVMQETVIPLLGQTYGSGDGSRFERTYWISFLLAFCTSAFAIGIFSLLWLLHPRLDTGTLPASTFGIAVASGAIRTVVAAFATPPAHAILITGRIVAFNAYLTAERLADLIAVAAVLLLMPEATEQAQADAFFISSALLYVVVQGAAFPYARLIDRRFAPRPTPIQRADLHWVRGIFGWNIALVVAFLIYLRLSTIVVNARFGESPTLILGLVFLLIGYQRQIAMGLVVGLDAVIARLHGDDAEQDGRETKISRVILESSYIQGIFSFASVTVLWVLAEPIFYYWLGDSLKDSGWSMDSAVTLFRVMAVGILARSLSENWMKLLSGRGLVGRYSRWVLLGACVYLGLMAVWVNSDLDADAVMLHLAFTFSILYAVVHLGAVPLVLCRSQGLSLPDLAKTALAPGLLLSSAGIALAYLLEADASLLAGLLWIATIAAISIAMMFHKRITEAILPRR